MNEPLHLMKNIYWANRGKKALQEQEKSLKSDTIN